MKRLMLSVAAVALGLFLVSDSFGHGPQGHGKSHGGHGGYGKSHGGYGGYGKSHGGYGGYGKSHGGYGGYGRPYGGNEGYKPPIYYQAPYYKSYCPPCGCKGQPPLEDPRFEEQGRIEGEGQKGGEEAGGVVERGGEVGGQEGAELEQELPALRGVRKIAKPTNGATLKKTTIPSNVPANRINPTRGTTIRSPRG